MDERPIVWDRSNLRHLFEDHPRREPGRPDVEEALADPDRIETMEERAGFTYHVVVGATRHGRLLVVVWVDHPGGRFPVHARQAGRRAGRRYYR